MPHKDLLEKKAYMKSYSRKYYLEHREIVLGRNKEYSKRNPTVMCRITRRWAMKNPQKKRAHNALNEQIRLGHISRAPVCQDCGTWCKTNAHHPNYDQPLRVWWLCKECHNKRHGEVA